MRAHSFTRIGFVSGDPELADVVDAGPGMNPLRIEEIRLEPGGWDGDAPETALGLLLIGGFLIRRVELGERHSIELLGPGDLLSPSELGRDRYATVSANQSWRALGPVRLAVLDEPFRHWIAQRPAVIDRLLGRMLQRSRTLAMRLALVQLPRTATRLHFLLWHLADRFGRVQHDGVLLPIPLSHAMLAELVSAQRPSVSRAMKQLERHGSIAPSYGGGWCLRGGPPAARGFGAEPQPEHDDN